MNRNHSRRSLQTIARELGIRFKNKDLLLQALTHRSFAFENELTGYDNEKLEFLGDAVLGLCVSDYLYRSFPLEKEGFLAKIKSTVVSERTLHQTALDHDLGRYIRLGRGEALSGGNSRSSILANTMEALIGAYYLDAGYQKTAAFVERLIEPHIQRTVTGNLSVTSRTALQELAQKTFKISPDYRLVQEEGPDNEKRFTMEVLLADICYGKGTDRTKKLACQQAANVALTTLQREISEQQLPPVLHDKLRGAKTHGS